MKQNQISQPQYILLFFFFKNPHSTLHACDSSTVCYAYTEQDTAQQRRTFNISSPKVFQLWEKLSAPLSYTVYHTYSTEQSKTDISQDNLLCYADEGDSLQRWSDFTPVGSALQACGDNIVTVVFFQLFLTEKSTRQTPKYSWQKGLPWHWSS